MHGPLAQMTQDLIGKARQWSKTNNAQTKALICEGTQVDKALIESEENMRWQLENLLETGGYEYFLVKYNLIDWDHFRTFVRTTEKFEWNFIISEKDIAVFIKKYKLSSN